MTNFELRKWQNEDAENIAVAANNPSIAKNLRNTFPSPYTIDDARWYVNDCIDKEGQNQITRAVVVDGKAVGSVGIFVKDDVFEKTAELGYWLSEKYWRRGITTRAVKLICKEAFAKFDIVRIYAEPFENNIGSRAVLEKSGFLCEGIMRNCIYKNGKILSCCIYSILREEIED